MSSRLTAAGSSHTPTRPLAGKFNVASAALLILFPLGLLVYDFVAKIPDTAWKFPESRYDMGDQSRDSLPLLRGPVVKAEVVAEAVRNHGGVRIVKARIEGPLSLSLEGLRRADIRADSVVFQGRVAFGARYREDTLPDSSRFLSLDIDNSEFHGAVDLVGGFYKVSMEDCRFTGDVKIDGVFRSIDEILFNGSTFERDVFFADINPIGDLNLYDVAFKGSVDFFSTFVQKLNTTRLRADSPINIRWSQFGKGWLEYSLSWDDAGADQPHRKVYVETGLMFWKNNFERLGYERDEREVRFELIKFRRKHMRISQVEWWAASLLEIPNGFGTSPYRPIWIGFLVINLFAVFYWWKNVFIPKDADNPPAYRPPLLVFSLLYSLDTFLPFLSATDARKWGLEVAPDYRGWELGERILGLVITVLSAYSIGSYLI